MFCIIYCDLYLNVNIINDVIDIILNVHSRVFNIIHPSNDC